ncbi:MAG: hypothetical protein ACI8QC_002829 [Planctomycetota bacterium]|jgi:hypothetical protein
MRSQSIAAGLLAFILAGTSGHSLAHETEPKGALVERSRAVSLAAHPERIVLERSAAYSQLLLTARDASGRAFDATRMARVTDESEHLTMDDRGLIRPLANGSGELLLQLDGVEVRVPYEVKGMELSAAPSFRNDVMPVLSASGCNTGSCHGSADGKQGFKLSLRGYDPLFDHTALTDDLFARRFDRVRPEQSLFLKKPTAAVPHGGGQALEPGSHNYETMRAWAQAGAQLDAADARVTSLEILPQDATIGVIGEHQQFAVMANYADGSRRDVTAHAFVETNDTEVTSVDSRSLVSGLRRGEAAIMARYEGQYAATRLYIRGDREGWSWEAQPTYNYIDERVYAKLEEIESGASELCTDAEYLRRVTLDLTGTQPAVRDTRQFLMDTRDSRVKREELVERLIGSPDFVDHWTNKWCDLLQVNSTFLGKQGARNFRDWVQAGVASNKPYDKFVHALLDTSGKTSEAPPASYYQILREPDLAMENSTQLFLGIRFNCNKCHDHPFERWTQKDHWQLASFFAQVDRKPVGGSAMLRGGVPADELIGDKDEGEVHYPDSTRVAPPLFPYEHAGSKPEAGTRRAQLAAWTTAPENPYFARSMANRLWSYFMGRGIIDPVDDIRAGNPATHPELLDQLTAQFIDEGFDLRSLMRTICNSRTYQHSVATTQWNAGDDINYGHALARRLPSEVLFDAVHQATGTRANLPGVRKGTRAVQLLDPSTKSPDGFLDLFGRPPRESACECERSGGMSLGQALNLINGPTLGDALRDSTGSIAELLEVERDRGAILEELYLSFLCRYPTAEETAELTLALDPRDIANRDALSPERSAALTKTLADWERDNRPILDWEVLTPVSALTTGKSTLEIQADGSVLATGEVDEKVTYTIIAPTGAGAITGVRLEVLPLEKDGNPSGPGRTEHGNFVLNEFRVSAVPLGMPTGSAPVEFQTASVSFAQSGWAPAGLIDGKPGTGWAIQPRYNQAHVAVFETKADLASSLLVINLDQNYGSQHVIGNLRISVTREARPVRHHAMPEHVAVALLLPAPERSAEQVAAIYREFISKYPALEQEILLSATQDLAWALGNSPAFLFNR